MTRILHIITRLDVGGSTENTLISATRLASEDFRCALAFGPTANPPAGLADTFSRSRVDSYRVPHLVRTVRPLADILALFELRAAIRKARPDVVHTHTSKAGFLGRLAARRERVPHIVHTPHGHVFHGYFLPPVTRGVIHLERLAARWTDRILTLTDSEAEQHLALGIGRREQFVTIPSGVDLDPVLAARPERLTAQGKIVGTVGRLAAVKGHKYLIRATPEILKQHPGATIVIVGDGEERQILKKLTESLGVAGTVQFTGHREDVASLIAGMDLFVLPSLNEGMGRVLVMAMALGKPIVATSVGGVPELLGHGEAGVLVPAADPKALADAVAALLRDPERARRLGEAGRRRAPLYSAHVMVESLERLYREILAEKAGIRSLGLTGRCDTADPMDHS
jgi:glycosyltransferase involved in cell wall biosynthesis